MSKQVVKRRPESCYLGIKSKGREQLLRQMWKVENWIKINRTIKDKNNKIKTDSNNKQNQKQARHYRIRLSLIL